jgi:hypothetical protein
MRQKPRFVALKVCLWAAIVAAWAYMGASYLLT